MKIEVLTLAGILATANSFATELEPVSVETKETFRDCASCPEMVMLKGGKFQMGNDNSESTKPLHEVEIKPFAMGKYEITLGEFKYFVDSVGYFVEKSPVCDWKEWKNKIFTESDRQPVQCISWLDAVNYAEWLSKKTGKNYRLPTEAEWEYAARAGTQTKWSFGDDQNELANNAWCLDNSDAKTHEVGQKKANNFGLYDMYGNVGEWTCGDYSDDYNTNVHKSCADKNSNEVKVWRGGCWLGGCNSFERSVNIIKNKVNYIGFRVVLNSSIP